MRLKERNHSYNINVQDQAVSASVEAVASYPEDLFKIIDEGVCSKQHMKIKQSFVGWIPFRIFLVREEKLVPSFKSSKVRVVLLTTLD